MQKLKLASFITTAYRTERLECCDLGYSYGGFLNVYCTQVCSNKLMGSPSRIFNAWCRRILPAGGSRPYSVRLSRSRVTSGGSSLRTEYPAKSSNWMIPPENQRTMKLPPSYFSLKFPLAFFHIGYPYSYFFLLIIYMFISDCKLNCTKSQIPFPTLDRLTAILNILDKPFGDRSIVELMHTQRIISNGFQRLRQYWHFDHIIHHKGHVRCLIDQ